MGLVRELLIAFLFGTSSVADAIRIAQHVFLVPLSMLSSEASSSSFIPQYRKYLKQNDKESAQSLYSLILIIFVFFSLIFTVIALLYTEDIILLFVSDVSNEVLEYSKVIFIPMTLCTIFYTLSILFIWKLQADDNFYLLSARPIVQNLSFILFMIISSFLFMPSLIGWGFSFAYIIIVIFSLIMYRDSLKPIIKINEGRILLGNFFKEYKYLILVVLIFQGLFVLERYFASAIGEGAIAALDYAKFAVESPHFMIGVPIATIALNYFSGSKLNEHGQVTIQLSKVLALILLPIGIMLLPFSEILMKLLYLRGEFDQTSLELTQIGFKGYILGLWAMSGSLVLQKIYNASLNSKKLIGYLLISFVISIVSNVLLINKLGLFGIGFSTSLFYATYLLLMIFGLGVFKNVYKYFVVGIVSSIFLYLSYITFDNLIIFILGFLIYYVIVCVKFKFVFRQLLIKIKKKY